MGQACTSNIPRVRLEECPDDLSLSSEKNSVYDEEESNLVRTKSKQVEKDLCVIVRICFYILVALLLVSMTVITTIYISHLQTHVQDLDAKQEITEKSLMNLIKNNTLNVSTGKSYMISSIIGLKRLLGKIKGT